MITVTQAAQQRFGEVINGAGGDCAGLRIKALRVGNHTFRYQMHLVREKDIQAGDQSVPIGPFKAYLDAESVEWLEGATIDFVQDAEGGGFDIDNPAAKVIWEDPIAQKVQKVLDSSISPSLAGHGGWCELVEVKGDVAHVRLGGGCQGCGGARMTVKHGIEAVIVREVPEIREVVDDTDHSAGEDPFAHGCHG